MAWTFHSLVIGHRTDHLERASQARPASPRSSSPFANRCLPGKHYQGWQGQAFRALTKPVLLRHRTRLFSLSDRGCGSAGAGLAGPDGLAGLVLMFREPARRVALITDRRLW